MRVSADQRIVTHMTIFGCILPIHHTKVSDPHHSLCSKDRPRAACDIHLVLSLAANTNVTHSGILTVLAILADLAGGLAIHCNDREKIELVPETRYEANSDLSCQAFQAFSHSF